MATGSVILFRQFIHDLTDGKHDLDADVIKCGLTVGGTVPSVSSADPRWGAGGTVNFKTDEVTPGGSYATDGIDAEFVTTASGATVRLTGSATALAWALNASSPSNCRYAVFYNNTSVGKECVFALDLGTIKNLKTAPLSIAPATGGYVALTGA